MSLKKPTQTIIKWFIYLILALAAIAFVSQLGHAQVTTTTLTGTVKGLDNVNVSSGKLVLTLKQSIDTTISGTARFIPGVITCKIVSGLIKAFDGVSPCVVTKNTTLLPPGTSYQIDICPLNVCISRLNMYAILDTVDISTLVPTPTTSPINNLIDNFSNQVIAGFKKFIGAVSFSGLTTNGPSKFDVSDPQFGCVGDNATIDDTCFDSAIAAAKVNRGVVYFPAMAGKNITVYRFNAAHLIPAGIQIECDNSSSVFLGVNYTESTDTNGFLTFDGSYLTNSGNGGGIRHCDISKIDANSGGAAIKIIGSGDTNRGSFLILDDIRVHAVLGNATGSWQHYVYADGSCCSTSGGQGLRDIHISKSYFFQLANTPGGSAGLYGFNVVHFQVENSFFTENDSSTLVKITGTAGNPLLTSNDVYFTSDEFLGPVVLDVVNVVGIIGGKLSAGFSSTSNATNCTVRPAFLFGTVSSDAGHCLPSPLPASMLGFVGDAVCSGSCTGTDNTSTMNSAATIACNIGGAQIMFPLGLFRFASKPNNFGCGLSIIGSGNGSTSQGETGLVADYNEVTAANGFLTWDGSFLSNLGTGGKIENLTLYKGGNRTGGTTIKITGSDDNHRAGFMTIRDVIPGGSGSPIGTWNKNLIIDGSCCTTAGGQGVRDIRIENFWPALATDTADAVLLKNAIQVFWNGGELFPAGAGTPVGVTIDGAGAGTQASTNIFISDVYITGAVTIDHAASVFLSNVLIGGNFSSTANTSGCSVVASIGGTITSPAGICLIVSGNSAGSQFGTVSLTSIGFGGGTSQHALSEVSVVCPFSGNLGAGGIGGRWCSLRPTSAITVTRVLLTLGIGPATCATQAVIRLSDGTTNIDTTTANTVSTYDSGALTQAYAAASDIRVTQPTQATGCGTFPSVASLTIQYRTQ